MSIFKHPLYKQFLRQIYGCYPPCSNTSIIGKTNKNSVHTNEDNTGIKTSNKWEAVEFDDFDFL